VQASLYAKPQPTPTTRNHITSWCRVEYLLPCIVSAERPSSPHLHHPIWLLMLDDDTAAQWLIGQTDTALGFILRLLFSFQPKITQSKRFQQRVHHFSQTVVQQFFSKSQQLLLHSFQCSASEYLLSKDRLGQIMQHHTSSLMCSSSVYPCYSSADCVITQKASQRVKNLFPSCCVKLGW
jgi:hypothetical protein